MANRRRITYVMVAVALSAIAATLISIATCQRSPSIDTEPKLTPEQSSHKILSEPAVFDPQNLESMAAEIKANHSFDVEQISLMIVAVESALNRLEQDTELLISNDDAADSWNVLSEYAAQQWIDHSTTIVQFLDKAPLSTEQASRVAVIHDTSKRINTLIGQIEKQQLRGRTTSVVLLY